ncbi:angiogenic factor with G patch and FHA domains 1 isoform X1 [Lingula anatina]|uniref:Angiogenic factor with G patch and FHA domains 1 isoform X1 n=1 Tax=Lingula anatina TaxID=7574 RepID=A0A1S3H0B8_LINAN|nr:angiogenic factor with G patch and FHA domains 1 isoform X1 [Lingula anatina]XP_013379449.1 angiogenic factor with G patch and FHA domains 1 isoform X1 [Lingula anatina]|eukprot:XP_013379448.1 angiogenic factor with G patch and FHA domains 1 isoform X1 [Lingula anatina]
MEEQPEVQDLKRKIADLDSELKSTQKKLEKALHKLSKTERRNDKINSYNEDLRKQVEQLSKELHAYKSSGKKRSDASTQVSEALLQESNGEIGQFEEWSEPVKDPESEEGVSLADSLKATAEAALHQSGYVYDDSTGLYYDYNTGYYYDAEKSLYYDPNTGIYYYYDAGTESYVFHSQADLSYYQTAQAGTEDFQMYDADTEHRSHRKHNRHKDKEEMNKRKEATGHSEMRKHKSKHRKLDQPIDKKKQTTSDIKDSRLNETKDMVDITEPTISKSNRTLSKNKRNKGKENLKQEEENSQSNKNQCVDFDRSDNCHSSNEEDTELEDGELSSSSSDNDSDSSSNSEAVLEEAMTANYPPCIRVMVKESSTLDVGTLYIFTYPGATIGREKDMGHAILIPDLQVSKMHAEVKYDDSSQVYTIQDYASQNGTFLNGQRLSEPKVLSSCHALTHGDTVQIADSTFLLHIHPGLETCDLCEPGQVQAHLKAQQEQPREIKILSKEDKEKLRRQEMKKIRKKFGLESAPYEQNSSAVNNPAYTDKAEVRRKTVGSDNPYQKDDAPASVDVAISTENKGHKLLKKMGWASGEGLGKTQKGIKEPIQVNIRLRQTAGLGSAVSVERSMDDAHVKNTQEKWLKAQDRFSALGQGKGIAQEKKEHSIKSKTWLKGETVNATIDKVENNDNG